MVLSGNVVRLAALSIDAEFSAGENVLVGVLENSEKLFRVYSELVRCQRKIKSSD